MPFSSTSYVDCEVLVRVDGVSKKFCRNLKKSLWYGVQDVIGEINPFRRSFEHCKNGPVNDPSHSVFHHSSIAGFPEVSLRDGEFWANQDISFELRRGECLGLIGHNGAGKTTLLKMLNGLIKPDRGRIEMRGRVGALIALGAGFNPILTGRENIYVNGAILGLRKREIDAKIDEIIDFAEISEFIDSPVQSYSSGMQVRLGFAAAVNLLRPDVLILDEVLAVGDAAFRAKCEKTISEIMKRAAVIFVSHSASHIQKLCERVLWLERGRVRAEGPTRELLPEYSRRKVHTGAASSLTCIDAITSMGIESENLTAGYGQALKLRIAISSCAPVRIETIVLGINVAEDIPAAQSRIATSTTIDGDQVLVVETEPINLRDGHYFLTLAIYNSGLKELVARHINFAELQIQSGNDGWAFYQLPANLTHVR